MTPGPHILRARGPGRALAALLAVLAGAWLVLAPARPAAAQGLPASPGEYDVKAAFLYNLALFTRPDGAGGARTDDYAICVHGPSNPFGGALAKLSGRAVDQRRVSVRTGVPTDQLRECSLVFFAGSERAAVARAASTLAGLPVVTVSEGFDAPVPGVMFNLDVAAQRIVFDVNTAAGRAARLDISANLMRLARAVH